MKVILVLLVPFSSALGNPSFSFVDKRRSSTQASRREQHDTKVRANATLDQQQEMTINIRSMLFCEQGTNPKKMLTNTRRAIRFFGTVPSSVSSLRSGTANQFSSAFTPRHFPKTLGVVAVAGLCTGFMIMDNIHDAVEREQSHRIEEQIRRTYGRKLSIRTARRATISSNGGLVDV